MIDEKINLEKDTKKCYEEQQKLLSNSSKIKALVNYNKLNNILIITIFKLYNYLLKFNKINHFKKNE
jgi:hypothetical protein